MERMRISMRAAALVAALGVAGCFSLGRAEPEQQHYVLGAAAGSESSAGSSDPSGLTVGLRRLRIASYLEAPYLVVREEPGRVSYAEFHRWAEPLDGGISRAIAGWMAGRGSIRAVDLAPWPARERYDYLVQLHVDRFEGVAGAGSDAGMAHVHASWEIIRQSDGTVLERGITEHQQPGWRAGDYPGLVRLLDAGLRAIAADVAGSLERLGVPDRISRAGDPGSPVLSRADAADATQTAQWWNAYPGALAAAKTAEVLPAGAHRAASAIPQHAPRTSGVMRWTS
jgi:uncharacterized protein